MTRGTTKIPRTPDGNECIFGTPGARSRVCGTIPAPGSSPINLHPIRISTARCGARKNARCASKGKTALALQVMNICESCARAYDHEHFCRRMRVSFSVFRWQKGRLVNACSHSSLVILCMLATRRLQLCFQIRQQQHKKPHSIQHSPSGILPPDAVRRHSTSGNGSPPTRHWNVTDDPTTDV